MKVIMPSSSALIICPSCHACAYVSRGAKVDIALVKVDSRSRPLKFLIRGILLLSGPLDVRLSSNDRIIATTWFIYKVFFDFYFLFFVSPTGMRCSSALSGVITVEANPAIASSTPLQLRKTFCAPSGKTANQAIHLTYAGKASTPPSPLSIIATNLTASSRTSTTGAKTLLAHPSRTAANMPLSI